MQVGCAGAILGYISRRKSVEFLPNDEAALVALRIGTVETFALSSLMFANADTLASLQILQSENHPNSHMQGPNKSTSGSKESLSIYGLFCHLARTPQGKQRLRQIFLRPSMDLNIITERLNTITVLLRPENLPSVEKLCKSLKMIKDIRTVVIHLRKGVSDVQGKGGTVCRGVWANIRNFTFHILKILEAIGEINDSQTTRIVSKVRPHQWLGLQKTHLKYSFSMT